MYFVGVKHVNAQTNTWQGAVIGNPARTAGSQANRHNVSALSRLFCIDAAAKLMH